jgi:hypothetical protein
MKCLWQLITTRLWEALNESASCGLGSDRGVHEELRHAYTCSGVPGCSCGHDGSLGNAPPGRLQVDGFLDQQCQQHWPKTSVRETTFSRHDKQTDSDVRLGCFQQMGRAACMPKPTLRVWSGISLPNSFPLTGTSTPVPSGNGGEENCISVGATAHVESSPQSNSWYAKTLQRKV